jgi:hypothetical protein
MHARDCRAGLGRTLASSLVAGQVALHDLRAGSSIVAVEGDLQLGLRDRSLAWLGDAVPLTSITLHEGERFIAQQSGIVSISAAHPKPGYARRVSGTHAAAFIVLPAHAGKSARDAVRHAARHLAGLVRTRLRRPA